MRPIKPRSGTAGQALSEYAILLALIAGAQWVAKLPDVLSQSPLAAVGVGAGVLLFVVWLFGGRR